MSQIRFLLVLMMVSVLMVSCSGKDAGSGRELRKGESEAEACLDEWFHAHGVDQQKLRTSIENYFIAGGITKRTDPLAKQYQGMLEFIARPSKPFPTFSDRKEIVQMSEQLGLSSTDILSKKQLSCMLQSFRTHSIASDSTSAFYAWGDILSTIEQVPNVSPGLVASALPDYMTDEDFNCPLYQTAIALMFYFDFTLFLKD
jgi:hypothetical protein